eukprot:TRINITY_DN11151_c0_g1_i1.p1 TRINITY_DN11151_c0_g1~~TRINITY_DN11151_c0_g1_i1.p1  ORF type:complete len:458 (-),score=68.23 TRINITY_DN11151_c0_g1_i1:87-1460(-)
MRISVINMVGGDVVEALDVDPGATVKQMDAQVPNTDGVLVRRQYLLGGLHLADEVSLSEAGVAEGSQLQMITIARQLAAITMETGSVQICDAASGEILRELTGPPAKRPYQFYTSDEADVRSVGFSPASTRVVTAGKDSAARIYDVAFGECLHMLEGAGTPLKSVAFSPNGSQVVIAPEGSEPYLYDVSSGKLLHVLKGHDFTVRSAVFSPDGTRVLSTAGDHTARVFDVDSGKCVHVLEGHEKSPYMAHFSPDGARIVTASEDNTARLWDAASGECLHMLEEHGCMVLSAVFSPDGTQVLTASTDKTARLYDAASGRHLQVLDHGGALAGAAFSPDGAQVVTYAMDPPFAVKLWDVGSGKCLHELKGHQSSVCSAAFSPDGSRLLTAAEDRTARLWDPTTAECLKVFKKAQGNFVAFSPGPARPGEEVPVAGPSQKKPRAMKKPAAPEQVKKHPET